MPMIEIQVITEARVDVCRVHSSCSSREPSGEGRGPFRAEETEAAFRASLDVLWALTNRGCGAPQMTFHSLQLFKVSV